MVYLMCHEDNRQKRLVAYIRKIQDKWDAVNEYSPDWAYSEIEAYYERRDSECAARFVIKFPGVKFDDAVRYDDDDKKYEIQELELH